MERQKREPTRWVHRCRRERGASLVEFALLAPILVLLIFGIVEFGRLGFAFTEVWSAAREGARYATTVGDSNGDGVPNFVDCDGIREAARGRLAISSLGDGQIDIEYLAPDGTPITDCGGSQPSDIDSGTQVRVTTTATFDAVVPVMSMFLDGVALDSSQVRTVNYGVLDAGP